MLTCSSTVVSHVQGQGKSGTWDPQNSIFEHCKILLMDEILHLLRLVVSPIIYYTVLYIPGGAGFLPSMMVGNSTSMNFACLGIWKVPHLAWS